MRPPTDTQHKTHCDNPAPHPRLWWLRKAIGYNERDPGALYPHLILADGSLFGQGLRWRAGDECAHLTGWHADCELESFSNHIHCVNLARRDYPDFPAPEFAVLPPAPCWSNPLRARREHRAMRQIRQTCYCCTREERGPLMATKPKTALLVAVSLLALAGCERRGNLRSGADQGNIPARTVASPHYDPYAAVGSANARWRPSVFDRDGTLFRPGGGTPSTSPYARPAGTF